MPTNNKKQSEPDIADSKTETLKVEKPKAEKPKVETPKVEVKVEETPAPTKQVEVKTRNGNTLTYN